MEQTEKKVVLITGASRGIGQATALLLAKSGEYTVYATMRSPEESPLAKAGDNQENLILKALDVTDDEASKKVVQEILTREGHIDVLINNAGQGLFGSAETVEIEKAKELFDVNFFGALRMIQAVLPSMREQHHGLIINISSIVGIRPGSCWDLYNASKFALEGLSESLAAVLPHWNIQMVLIEPGPVATDFGENTSIGTRFENGNNPYGILQKNAQQRMQKYLQAGQAPQEVALLISHVIKTENPSVRYQTTDNLRKYVGEKHIDPTGNQVMKNQRKVIEDLWRSFSER